MTVVMSSQEAHAKYVAMNMEGRRDLKGGIGRKEVRGRD